MAMEVIGPIVHSSSRMERAFNETLGKWLHEGTDVYQVNGLTDGSSDQSRTALNRALFAKGLPADGSPYRGVPGQYGCVLTGRRVQGITGNDDSVLVFCDYSTLLPLGPTSPAVVISMSRDTIAMKDTTYTHPATGAQLAVLPPSNSGLSRSEAARLTPTPFVTSLPLTRLVITAKVIAKNLDDVENAVNGVNDQTWLRFPKGYWWFSEFSEQATNADLSVTVECTFVTQRTQNWMEKETARSDMLGIRQGVDAKTLAKAYSQPYVYDQIQFPGITVAGFKPLKSFRSLFGIG